MSCTHYIHDWALKVSALLAQSSEQPQLLSWYLSLDRHSLEGSERYIELKLELNTPKPLEPSSLSTLYWLPTHTKPSCRGTGCFSDTCCGFWGHIIAATIVDIKCGCGQRTAINVHQQLAFRVNSCHAHAHCHSLEIVTVTNWGWGGGKRGRKRDNSLHWQTNYPVDMHSYSLLL